MKIIKGESSIIGFMIHFEHAGDGFLRSDHFPDKHGEEPLIKTEIKAWRLANSFAVNTKGRCINIYVIDQDFNPVKDYENKKIENR